MMKGFTKRIPLLSDKQDVSAEHHAAFDKIVSQYQGSLVGPYQVLMHSPDLASRVVHTASYVRFETTLPQDVYKLVVLTATRELDCQYAWTVHQPTAAEAGVREEAVIAIRDRKAPEGLTEDEALVVTYVQELLRTNRVSEPTFKAALEKFGVQKLVDLTVTIGHYGILAFVLNAFEVMPETPLLPV